MVQMTPEQEEHNKKLFWKIFEWQYGIDKLPEWKRNLFWDQAAELRQRCWYSDSPETSITECLPFDKQAMLNKWWPSLSIEDKKKYLIHVWLNKGTALMFGYGWWVPYFEETGFLTNYEIDVPEKIRLYRGSLPWLRDGMSWTPDKEFATLFADQYEESSLYMIDAEKVDILGVFEGTAGIVGDDSSVRIGIEYVLNSAKIVDRIIDISE